MILIKYFDTKADKHILVESRNEKAQFSATIKNKKFFNNSAI